MKRFWKISPSLILFLGFALRMYRLGAQSLWYDETVSIVLAQSELAELIRHTAGDIHPPLYYLILHFWGRLAGWSEFAMAFVSLWFGVLLIALVFRITRAWLAQYSIAVIAALFVALSPYNIWYSQEVRMYTLGAVLGLLSVYFLRRMMQSQKIFSRDFFAYVIFTVLGLYTLYYFVFLLVFQYIYVAYRALRVVYRREASIKHRPYTDYRFLFTFLLSQLTLLLLYLPWLPTAFRQATDPPVPPWREFIALPRVILETFSALAFGQAVDWNVFGFFALLLFIPIGVLLWREYKSSVISRQSPVSRLQSPSALFQLGYFLIPLAAIYLFSLWKPLYHVRYLFTYAPPFYMLVAYAVVNLSKEFQNARREHSARGWYALGAVAMLTSIGFFAITGFSLYNFWHNPQYAKDDLRGAVNYIAERWRPGDVILVNAGYVYPAFLYYFPDPITRRVRLPQYAPLLPGMPTLATASRRPILLMTGSIDGSPNLGWGDTRSDFYATTADETRAALERVLDGNARVWMLRLYDTVVDPNGVVRDELDARARLFDEQAFSGESQLRVQGYVVEKNVAMPANATLLLELLANRVQIVGYESGARNLRAGEPFDVVLYLRPLETLNVNYQITLQLLNANGENVAQTDELPLGAELPMTRWKKNLSYREPLRLKIPPTLAPGEYRAIVKLYDPRSGEVLGKVIELGSVQVR